MERHEYDTAIALAQNALDTVGPSKPLSHLIAKASKAVAIVDFDAQGGEAAEEMSRLQSQADRVKRALSDAQAGLRGAEEDQEQVARTGREHMQRLERETDSGIQELERGAQEKIARLRAEILEVERACQAQKKSALKSAAAKTETAKADNLAQLEAANVEL